MCFNVGGLGWVSTWGLGKKIHFATYFNCHICMYMNQIASNKYSESYSISIVCSWMYLLWLSSAFVLEHMHL